MNVEDLRDYALSKPQATESFPFGQDALVFKVSGKMFLATNLGRSPFSFNAKCDPSRAIELREKYEGIQPGYHMNKEHWNTVLGDGSVPESLMYELIDHSYELVAGNGKKKPAVKKTTKKAAKKPLKKKKR